MTKTQKAWEVTKTAVWVATLIAFLVTEKDAYWQLLVIWELLDIELAVRK